MAGFLGSLIQGGLQVAGARRQGQRERKDYEREAMHDLLQQRLLESNLQELQRQAQTQSTRAQQLATLRAQRPDLAGLPDEELANAAQTLATQKPGQRAAHYDAERGIVVYTSPEGKATTERVTEPRPSVEAMKPPTEGERKASALYISAKGANEILRGSKPPSLYETTAEFVLPKQYEAGALGAERESVNQAGRQFADALLRFTSGANTPEPEVQRYISFLLPAFGDEPATLKQKAEARDRVLEALRVAAGRALGKDPDPNEAVNILATVATTVRPSGTQGYRPNNPFAPKTGIP